MERFSFERLTAFATSKLGEAPEKHGKCLGFVRAAYAAAGREFDFDPLLGAQAFARFRAAFVEVDTAEPGDLLQFDAGGKLGAQHVAIVESKRHTIESAEGMGVIRRKLQDALREDPKIWRLI